MTTTAPHPSRHPDGCSDDLWQTLLFAGPRSRTTVAADGGVGPRLAYQLLLHGRAVLVDTRSHEHRACQGEVTGIASAPDLATALASAAPAVVVLGDAPAVAPAGLPVHVLVGGIEAWAAAGLPTTTGTSVGVAA